MGRINSTFGTIEYSPVVYLQQDIDFSHYLALLSIADSCLITSLRDGMNLTSHEYGLHMLTQLCARRISTAR